MARIISILILAVLLPTSLTAQDAPEWLQSVERTADNPQIHKQDILDRLPNQNIIQHALRTPYVKPEYKVYDFAGVLSEEDAQSIQRRVNAMVSESGLDAAVVFIKEPSWDDFDNEDFNHDFYDYNDFGAGEKHDGVCIVVNMATHRFAIFDTGTPTEHNVAGYYLVTYIDIIQPYFRSDEYAEGVIAFLDEFERNVDYELNTPWWLRISFFASVIISFILGLIITSIRSIRMSKVVKATLATSYEVPNSFRLTVKRDTFVSTHTTKTYIPPASSSSSGGSSSGTSHSGGSGGW